MAVNKGDTFKPGDVCKESGIYRVIHDPKHTAEHEVTVVDGEKFPPCNHCGNHPRFVLDRAAQHLAANANFKK